MPEMTPLGNTVRVPDPNQTLHTLSGILGIRQQQQDLQTGAIQQQRTQAAATIEGQTAKENQALAQLLQDPVGNGITDAKGNPVDGAFAKIQAVAPTTGAENFGKITKAAQSKVEFTNAANNLNANERSEFNSAVAGWAADPNMTPEQMQENIASLVDFKKGTPAYSDYQALGATTQQMIQHVNERQAATGTQSPKGNEPWRQAALGAGRSVLGAAGVVGAGGIATPQSGTMDTGTAIQPGTTAPALQGGAFTPTGQAIPKSSVMVGPGGNFSTVTPANNSVRPIGGGGGGAHPGPRSAADDQPAPNAPAAEWEQYNKATAAALEDVQAARSTDKDYGTNVHIANTIRNLSSSTETGPGTAYWHRGLALIPGYKAGQDANADYQLIGAYLDRQAALASSSMGLPNTNAGMGAAQTISGTTQYNQKALQDKNDLTQSIIEGAHQYRNGLDRLTGFTPNPSPTLVNQFKSAWANAYDPNVYRLDIAKTQGKDALTKFVQTLSPAEAASLQQKRAQLHMLSEGKLPQ